MFVTTLVTNEITTAAKIADQKLFTSNLSLQRATNIKIAALTTTRNNPKVRITAGKVKTLISDPRVALSKPNKRATHKYVVKPPITSIPGINAVATQKDRAKAPQRTNNFMKKL
jgi:hypothetical protein